MIDKITLFFPYYNQPDDLENQLTHYSSFPEWLKKKIYILVVDDGSQKSPALDAINKKYLSGLNIILHRIDIDIPWNMPEANNVAFLNSPTEWVLRTDIDHTFTLENMRRIFMIPQEDEKCYIFQRYDNKDELLGKHMNTFLINKETYREFGWCNEYLSGNYGYDEYDFWERFGRNNMVMIRNIGVHNTGSRTPDMSRDNRINVGKMYEKQRPLLCFLHQDKYQLLLKNIIY